MTYEVIQMDFYSATQLIMFSKSKSSLSIDSWDFGTLLAIADESYRGERFVVHEWKLTDGTSLFYNDYNNTWSQDADAKTYFLQWDNAESLLKQFGLLDKP